MILVVGMTLLVIIGLVLLVRSMVSQANRLEKMGWIFFHQFVFLGDERALNGFRLIFCVLSQPAKEKFREMMHRKYMGITALFQNKIDDPEWGALPNGENLELYALMEGALPRIIDCQEFASKRMSVPASHLRTIKQVFAQGDPELVRAVNKAELSFAVNLQPRLEVTDYHDFAAH